MKAYTYRPDEMGLAKWPEGELRLEGSIPVMDPEEADVFIVPGCLRLFNSISLYVLPHFKGNESKHVVLDVSDDHINAIGTQAIIIRCNMREWMWEGDPNSIPFAWPVEDYAECVDLPADGFKYDVSSQAWMSSQTRIDAAESCQRSSIKCDIASYKDFTGYIYYEPEGIRRRAEFRRSMRESRIMLCGESIKGVLPYRFFEAMSASRVPMLVSTGYVLPFEKEIPYDKFIMRCEASEANRVGSVIGDFLSKTSDEKLVEMGRMGRKYWLEFLNSADWPRTMAMAVKSKLGIS
jgi:hypothetical protein